MCIGGIEREKEITSSATRSAGLHSFRFWSEKILPASLKLEPAYNTRRADDAVTDRKPTLFVILDTFDDSSPNTIPARGYFLPDEFLRLPPTLSTCVTTSRTGLLVVEDIYPSTSRNCPLPKASAIPPEHRSPDGRPSWLRREKVPDAVAVSLLGDIDELRLGIIRLSASRPTTDGVPLCTRASVFSRRQVVVVVSLARYFCAAYGPKTYGDYVHKRKNPTNTTPTPHTRTGIP